MAKALCDISKERSQSADAIINDVLVKNKSKIRYFKTYFSLSFFEYTYLG